MGCEWTGQSWLTAGQALASPGYIPHFWARALLSLGSSLALGPCPALPLATTALGTPTPSTFSPSCNLLEGGFWLAAGPWTDSFPLSSTHFVSTQQAGVSLAL